MPPLLYQPFVSVVDGPFWHDYADRKLNQWRLSTEPTRIQGYYQAGFTRPLSVQQALPSSYFWLNHGTAFFEQPTPVKSIACEGELIHTNTIEDFQRLDKKALVQRVAEQMWQDIVSEEAWTNPSRLFRFLVLVFGDLKKHTFRYCFAFPTFKIKCDPIQVLSVTPLLEEASFQTKEMQALFYNFMNETIFDDLRYHGVVVVEVVSGGGSLKFHPLKVLLKEDPRKSFYLAWIDPNAGQNHPGWPLRNLLVLIQTKLKNNNNNWQQLQVICVRISPSAKQDLSQCILLTLKLTPLPFDLEQASVPESTGWEKNAQGQLAVKTLDLSLSMDPTRLAEAASELNLKLMRWRRIPDLDLQSLSSCKCLILGAGTLGCYVARTLIAWGVRTITFVDNGLVSHSNPVRQPLFTFKDVHQPKADAAARGLKSISPSIQATGHRLTIPMPGHPDKEETVKLNLTGLTDLVRDHDAVFLLTDNRESRWLPTVLGLHFNKMVVNAALGFDSFVVLRHGSIETDRKDRLGCYFCNDVVAPLDSLKDRTLDQQCTVTRPGLAPIAAATAVELLASLLQTPNRYACDTTASSLLGKVPHQIRGFLSQFSQIDMCGKAYEKCTACSDPVLETFSKDPLALVTSVLADPLLLEQLTGLDQLKLNETEIETLSDDLSFDDIESLPL